MKLRHILILLLLIVPFATQAQKYACVNTDYVLRNLPDYSQAQQRLDKYVSDWQREIEGKMQELETLRQSFQQEAYLLPDNLKNRRAQEIKTRDQEVRDLQRKRFAADGDLDKKRAELLKPIQDRVYSAIERIAKEKGFSLVLDKAGSATVLFASEKIDITNDVLQVLGVKESDVESNAAETTSKTGKKAPTNPELRTL
ncbi:MAG: OmpH family outer membrane protein, partial [Bacteroidales bacterium]|nr:OmpH family outer membrane protein [Bacteroidales bacterium]